MEGERALALVNASTVEAFSLDASLVARLLGETSIKKTGVIRDELKRGRCQIPEPSCTCVVRSDAITGHAKVHKAQAEFASPVISKKMAFLHDWI